MRVLLDLDGVVADIWEPWFSRYNAKTGDDLTVEKTLAWDVPAAKDHKALFAVLSEPGFYRDLQPFPGAVEAVRGLVDAGDEVYVLSAAPSVSSWSEKAWWCERYLPFIPQKHIILTHAKALVKGDVLLDDGPHNLAAYRAAWPQALLATVFYPYNEVEALRHANAVVGTWKDMPAAWAEFTRWTNEVRKYVDR